MRTLTSIRAGVLTALVLVASCATINTAMLSPESDEPKERRLMLAQSIPPDTRPGSIYEVKVYIVQPGDTTAKICQRFRLTEAQLSALNPQVKLIRTLIAKQRLVIHESIQSPELF